MAGLSDFGILHPAGAICFVAVVLALLLVWSRESVRKRRLGMLGINPVAGRAMMLALTALVPLVLCLAAMKPYLGSQDLDLTAPGDDYMMVVDVSRSMLARDVGPARIELAKRKLKDLLSEFVKEGASHRFGITLFAGESYLFCPLTSDLAVVRQFIDSISPEMVTSLGSNVEAGIQTALERFGTSHSKSGKILLVSDGEDDQLALENVVSRITGAQARVDVLGIGTPEGGPIQLENGSFVKHRSGQTVVSHLNEPSLIEIARAGQGIYVRATLGDADIKALAESGRPGSGSISSAKRKVRTYGEFGSWLSLLALLVLIALTRSRAQGNLLRALVLSLILPLAAGAQVETPAPVPTEEIRDPARAAYESYVSGNYEQALALYEAALRMDPGNRILRQGYASALFKTGKTALAQKMFAELASQTDNGREYFDNEFNNGNSLLALKRYQDAIDSYTKALDVKPEDERAIHNRRVARALLEEEKKNRTQTPTPTPTPDPSRSPTAPTPTPSPSPSSPGTPLATSSPEPTPTAGSSPTTGDGETPTPAPTPDSAASPEPSPNGTAGPQGSPNATPSPSGDESPQPGSDESPSPAPSPSSASAPADPTEGADEDSRLREALEEQETEASPTTAPGVPTQRAAEDLTQSEAEAWLESLPDSPLLIRRKHGNYRPKGQSW